MALLRGALPPGRAALARRGVRRPGGRRPARPVVDAPCARSPNGSSRRERGDRRPLRLGRRGLLEAARQDRQRPATSPTAWWWCQPGTEQDLLRPMKVDRHPGRGPGHRRAAAPRRGAHGRRAGGDLRGRAGPRWSGQAHGTSLYRLARARDDRPVVAEREAKSVSAEDTYDIDLVDRRLLEGLSTGTPAEGHRPAAQGTALGPDRHREGPAARLHHAHPLHHAGRPHRQHPGGRPDGADAAVRGGHLRRSPTARASVSRGWPTGSRRTCSTEDDRRAGEDGSAASSPPPSTWTASPRAGRWAPGMDVEHSDHGPGWVWGSGVGRVTVRFETADTPAGPVRTFRADDPGLTRRVSARAPAPPTRPRRRTGPRWHRRRALEV